MDSESHESSRAERILEVARRLLAESGYRGVTVRELAREAEVSVPTLYNQFGGKDPLLLAAVESDFERLMQQAESEGGSSGLEQLISLIEAQSSNLANTRAYSKILLDSFAAHSPHMEQIARRIGEVLGEHLERSLARMAEEGALVDWIPPRTLARRVGGQCFVYSMFWSQGYLDDAGLRRSMLQSAYLTLLGVTTADAAKEIEARLRDVLS